MMQIKVIDPAALAAAAERSRAARPCPSPMSPRALGHGDGQRLSPSERTGESDAAEAQVEFTRAPSSGPLGRSCPLWSGFAWEFRSGFVGAAVGTVLGTQSWGVHRDKLILGGFKVFFSCWRKRRWLWDGLVLFVRGLCPRDAAGC